MKRPLQWLMLAVLVASGCEQATQTTTVSDTAAVAPGALRSETVEVGCGMCIYDMSGVAGCKLAVVVDGTPMLASGIDVSLHDHGLCTAPRQAVVSGQVGAEELPLTEFEIR